MTENGVSKDDLEVEEHAVQMEVQPLASAVDTITVEDDGDARVAEGDSREGHGFATEGADELLMDREEDTGEAFTSGEAEAEEVSEAEQVFPLQDEPRQQKSRHGLKHHPGQGEGKDVQIAALMKKLNQAKKINSELHSQLQRFYTNDVVLQLENRVKEKQKRIEELMLENRTLKNSERILAKKLEDLQNSKDNIPSKRRALQEELRVCKERIKQLKEQYRVADEKGFKLHQQSFDLAVKNKGLSERVRLLEDATTPSSLLLSPPSTVRIGVGAPVEGVSAIIASQEEDITRLHQRVALIKKAHKAEQAKYERLLKSSKDEIDQTRAEMEEFYKQLFAKERAARVQFLHMKKLKHALHELANTQQTNQRFQPFLANREMRMTNRSNGSRHHVGPHSPQKGQIPNPGRWIHEALHHLGFVMPLAPHDDDAVKPPIDNKTDDEANIPENCVKGTLVPSPPPATVGFSRKRGSRHSYNQSGVGAEEHSDGDNYDMAETALHTPENPDEALVWED